MRGLHSSRVWRGQCHGSMGQGACLRQLAPRPARWLHSRGAATATLRPAVEHSEGNSVPATGLDGLPAPLPDAHLILLTGQRCAPSTSGTQGSSSSSGGSGGSSSGARQEVVTSALHWGEPVVLPPEWSAAVTAAAAGAAGAPRRGSNDEVTLTVWLSSPSGPAVARLGPQELQELCRGETLSVRAAPLQQPLPGELELVPGCIWMSGAMHVL